MRIFNHGWTQINTDESAKKAVVIGPFARPGKPDVLICCLRSALCEQVDASGIIEQSEVPL